MQKTWIDGDGFLRLKSENNQFIIPLSPLDLDPWLLYDVWDADLAIKLITIGYNLDMQAFWEEAKDFPEGSTGLDSARAYFEVYNRAMSIAESSICAGLLKNPDTTTNWIAWAKKKGYKVDHLSPSQFISKLENNLLACKNEELRSNYSRQIEKLKNLASLLEIQSYPLIEKVQFPAMPEILSSIPDISKGTPPKLTQEERAEVVRLYSRGRGTSVNALAKQFHVSRPTIDAILIRAGIKQKKR